MIDEFKNTLKKNSVTGKSFSKQIGLDYASYRSMTKKNVTVPKWIKAFIIGYKLGRLNK